MVVAYDIVSIIPEEWSFTCGMAIVSVLLQVLPLSEGICMTHLIKEVFTKMLGKGSQIEGTHHSTAKLCSLNYFRFRKLASSESGIQEMSAYCVSKNFSNLGTPSHSECFIARLLVRTCLMPNEIPVTVQW